MPLPAADTADGYALTVTNTHTAEQTVLTATKFWNDADDQDGKCLENIVLHLLANGRHMGSDYTKKPVPQTGMQTATGIIP